MSRRPAAIGVNAWDLTDHKAAQGVGSWHLQDCPAFGKMGKPLDTL